MAVKLLFDRGPLGRHINTKKRVRLILGSCDSKTPPLFKNLRAQAEKVDTFLKIDFVHFVENADGDVELLQGD